MINLIDSPYLCYRTMYGMKGTVLSEEEMRTEVIFGFLKQLLLIAKRLPADTWVFAWDSRRSLRKEVYPRYKENRRKREKTPEEEELLRVAYIQFGELRRKVLPGMGFRNVFVFTGYESDDIIAKACDGHKLLDDLVIVSSDEDLYQLIDAGVSFYNPHKKGMMTLEKFLEKYGITPAQWVEVKAIGGCSTDNIEGVKGVGEATAIKYINGQLKPIYKTYKAIRNSENIIERNRPLVKLPYKDTPSFEIKEDHLKRFDFMRVFKEYGFKSFLFQREFHQWETAFGLK